MSSAANAKGATTNPAAHRQRSNRTSASLIRSTASTVLSIGAGIVSVPLER